MEQSVQPARPTRSAATRPPREGLAERLAPAETTPVGLTWLRRKTDWLLQQLNGELGLSYAMSLFAHMVLLALLAIPVYRTLQERDTFTTLVTGAAETNPSLAGPLDTAIDLPPTPQVETDSQLALLEVPESPLHATPLLPDAATSSVASDAAGSGREGAEAVSVRLTEPDNAIRAGSFSVWPWPIEPGKKSGDVVHGEPGADPQVKQDYDIVIRLRVPDGRSHIALADITGVVVGTDQYTQRIPDDAYFYNTIGKLIPARTGRLIPVIEGTAEILVRVPGAANPYIRDTITVRSKSLKEEQRIELVFQPKQ